MYKMVEGPEEEKMIRDNRAAPLQKSRRLILITIGLIFTVMMLLILFLVWPMIHGETLKVSKSAVKDDKTTLVLFGTRHGNRNPENFVLGEPKNDKDWGHEGALELTKFGKRQGLGLGLAVRQFIGDLVKKNYVPKEAKFYSSSANRCQMTLQAATSGIYTPVDWADWRTSSHDNWSPVPYTIDDPLLRMYAVEQCPLSDDAWRPISQDTLPELTDLHKKEKKLLDYMAKNTGWNASISSAADLADNIILIKLYKSEYPKWIEKPTLKGYTKDTLIKAFMEFAESHQNKCAEYGPCRNLMAGVWLKHIVDAMKKAAKGEGPKLIGYASHTEVTLAVMKIMGMEKEEITTSAGFVIEFQKSPTPRLRLLNHEPNPVDDHIIYKADLTKELGKVSDKAGWIKLDAFEKLMKPMFIENWQSACGRKDTCGTKQ